MKMLNYRWNLNVSASVSYKPQTMQNHQNVVTTLWEYIPKLPLLQNSKSKKPVALPNKRLSRSQISQQNNHLSKLCTQPKPTTQVWKNKSMVLRYRPSCLTAWNVTILRDKKYRLNIDFQAISACETKEGSSFSSGISRWCARVDITAAFISSPLHPGWQSPSRSATRIPSKSPSTLAWTSPESRRRRWCPSSAPGIALLAAGLWSSTACLWACRSAGRVWDWTLGKLSKITHSYDILERRCTA